jgi:hypothetical protein
MDSNLGQINLVILSLLLLEDPVPQYSPVFSYLSSPYVHHADFHMPFSFPLT